MRMPEPANKRVLIAVPAYNEENSIGGVIERLRELLPEFDLLVINDGSSDATGRILESLGVVTATHLSNLGYGRAIQTAVKYALSCDYDTLITLDADGQHHPEQIQSIYEESVRADWDVLIGSRYVKAHSYSNNPLGRRVGMQIFSALVRLITKQQIYDTTSGLKVVKRTVYEPLAHWHFVDFHSEAIVYLIRLGYRIGEYPITVSERTQGQSMYSALSHLKYPLKTSLMLLLGIVQAELVRRRKNL